MARYGAKPIIVKTANRKPKFQKICGWETGNDTFDEIDIDSWVHIQQQSYTRKDKLRIPPEQIAFKHVPKHRCVGLEDKFVFEKTSLHEKFYNKAEDEKRTKTHLIPSSPVVSKSAPTVKKPLDNSVSENDGRQSRDDLDVSVAYSEERSKTADVSSSSKRTRSVPVTRAMAEYKESKAANPSHTMRRMMYYAKKYGNKDNIHIIHDEDEAEDEGYGSKTPSAEDSKPFDSAELTNNWATDYFKNQDSSSSILGVPKPKFSYTHQSNTKSQLYGDSEDGETKEVDYANYIQFYKTGYVETAKKILTSKPPERTTSASIVNGYDSVHGKLEDLKPVTMVLRKISIQDSENEQTQNMKSVPEEPPEQMYDVQRSIARSYSNLQQSDRPQYPVTCTSPELKFFHSQRPPSRQSTKLKMDLGKNHSDMVLKPGISVLDFARSHTSVCMPIGELIPAMDRSLKTKYSANSSNDSTISLPNTARDSIARETPRDISKSVQKLSSADDAKLDYYSERKMIIGSPFRQPKVDLKVNEKPTQPLYLLDAYASPSLRSSQDSRTSQPKAKEVTAAGIRPFELALSGYRVEINGENDMIPIPKKPKSLRKLKIAKPDKDTKKKLRDAFSRFYNKRPTCGPTKANASWSEDCRYIWNT